MVRPRRHQDGPGGFRNGPPGGNGGYGGPGYDAPHHPPYGARNGGYRDGPRPFDSYDSYRPGPPPPRFGDDRYHARPPPPRDFRGPPGPRFYSDSARHPPPPRDNWGGPRDGPRSDGIPPWELRQRRHDDTGNGRRPPPALFSSRSPIIAPLASAASGRRGTSPPLAPRSPRPPVILPPDDYVGFSAEGDVYSDHVEPKLLVLDLNGALVYRSASGMAKTRRAYPRPFLHNFLEYLFGPDADGRAWEVFVWSSAQPHNVRKMVETTFGPEYSRGVWDQPERTASNEAKEQEGEEVQMTGDGKQVKDSGHLLGVWARDKMSLGENYFKKVQTQKDLRKVIEHLGKYDEKSVVLLDDSPAKGVYQPWSQIVITEYDKPEYKDSKDAIMRLTERTAKSLKVSDPEPEAEAAEKEASPSEEPTDATAGVDPTHEPGLDTTLLAVIGILEAMRNVKNVPAFVRGGGILSPSAELAIDSSEVTASTLPSHATFAHWFANADTLDHWTQKGRAALERRGIPLDHGMRFSPSGEFYPLGEDTPLNEEQESKDASKDVGKGKLLKGKKAEAAYRHLQAVAEGDLVSEHQRSAVWAALQVLKDIGLAPEVAEGARPRSPPLSPRPQDAQDAASSASEPVESKKRPRHGSKA